MDTNFSKRVLKLQRHLATKDVFEFETKYSSQELREVVYVDGVEVIDIKMSEVRTFGTAYFVCIELLKRKLCVFKYAKGCGCGDNELHVVSKVLSELGREDLRCPDATVPAGSIPAARIMHGSFEPSYQTR